MPSKPGEHEPYDLEPEQAQEAAPRSAPSGKAKIDAEPLLEGFEEDADFTHDPEVERAVAGSRPPPAVPVRVTAELPEFVKGGLGDARIWGIVGGVLAGAALVATAITTQSRSVAATLLALYSIALHAGTGVVAVYIGAMLSERRVTRVELTAARMLTAVAAFSLVFHLSIRPFGDSFNTGKTEEVILGAAAYLAVVAGTFRLARRPLLYVVGAHFALWLIVRLGQELAAYVGSATSVPGPA